jgi:hypothetical protein
MNSSILELAFLIIVISILGWISILMLLKKVFTDLQIYLNQLKNIQDDLKTIKEKLKELINQ